MTSTKELSRVNPTTQHSPANLSYLCLELKIKAGLADWNPSLRANLQLSFRHIRRAAGQCLNKATHDKLILQLNNRSI